MKELKSAMAISPSGRRVGIAFYEAPGGRIKAYRKINGEPANWEISLGWNFNTIEHAIEIITNKGWSVEMDQ